MVRNRQLYILFLSPCDRVSQTECLIYKALNKIKSQFLLNINWLLIESIELVIQNLPWTSNPNPFSKSKIWLF